MPDLTRSPGSPLPRERGRKTGGRQRTLTELSEPSNRSESSHSVIDLDKYIDQADLFYQAPTSPRRDLIKRYSEQMTDERIANTSAKANSREKRRINPSNLSSGRNSRLIDEVLTDYFNLGQEQSEQEDVVVKREESDDVEDLVHQFKGIGEGSRTTNHNEVSSDLCKLESNSSRPSSRSSKISLVPSIVDIYEAHRLSRSQVSSSSDTSTLVGSSRPE
ncbi:hypothetical protein CROQUDRAFT_97524 [Cronartium quercuum f. sp. fusiforme G11]|uniref:Uncharacterized protein n=1 Tax=Cronartium quercuum f. sp. fusiforme G11 TaxID=708437 RepID=A0A9P6NE10_9BASI|nr:hypothetical protein CROQUDRAFT_97524 [Cronartium quercuum f. sp. fusiforme G11]